MEDSQIAAGLSAQLAERLGAQRFELWFGASTRFCVTSTGLKILAASAFVRDWLRTNFAEDIRVCWESIVGRPLPIAFEVDEEVAGSGEWGVGSGEHGACSEEQGARSEEQRDGSRESGVGAVGARPLARRRTDDMTRQAATVKLVVAGAVPRTAEGRPMAELTFDGFIAGAANEYALRAAQLTASGLQQASPVLWWGATGVGKTHLLRAMVREYRRRHPRSSAVYLSAEQFTTGFVEAVRGSGLPSFRQKCRGANLLVIDDLQFFVGKARTVEELQYTVDTLLAEGKQLALASDRSLGELRALGPELMSRLAGGLVCAIEPPEFATRLGILRRLRDELRVTVTDEILACVANQITGGARELRGAMHRLQLVASTTGEPLSAATVEESLRELARQYVRPVRLADVERAVCDLFGVEPSQLRSDRKGRSVSEPRMLAMWLARKYTRAAWIEIGQHFGRRSHSTVIAAHRRVEQMISTQGEVGLGDQPCQVEDALRRLEAVLRSA